ncbi:MAG TPA: purine-nucleoside phosphorylase [Gammaproteobacteria bacterium]|nr:purine-nucleoside phosphorylase [Gammaproteobacteria bacterium]
MPSSMIEVMQVIQRYVPKNFAPKIGMILGSGLSSLAEQIVNPVVIPYQAIPHLTGGSVAGHSSLLAMGHLNSIPVVCLRGRLHLYEGVSYAPIRILIRILKRLGCNMVLITCAAGSLQEKVGAGEIMMITDHISLHPGNPLVGVNDETIGPRFVAMEDAYDPGLQDLLRDIAKQQQITLHQGVYISTLGPSFETPAEIRAFKKWGADAVGMSVVPEVILARHCGMRVACLAAITNLAAGLSKEKITHEATLHYGKITARTLTKLIPQFVQEANDLH